MSAQARLLQLAPKSHQSTTRCDEPQNLKAAWAAAAAYLSGSVEYDTSSSTVSQVFFAFTQHIRCHKCIENRDHAIRQVVAEWPIIIAGLQTSSRRNVDELPLGSAQRTD
ncbi:hypothetical protein VKT23_016467 [Stygiomarasmius scandens]|uniref:Sulfhydryl oxidase n=1 Tax=Marasmiellus scandens TaxID=2682957 RepID=A0ABR1IV54_9AGAR